MRQSKVECVDLLRRARSLPGVLLLASPGIELGLHRQAPLPDTGRDTFDMV